MKNLTVLILILFFQYSYSQKEPKPSITNYEYDSNNNLVLSKNKINTYKYKYNSENLLIEEENLNRWKKIKVYENTKLIKEYNPKSFETIFLYKRGKVFKKIRKEFSGKKEFNYLTIYKYKKNGDTISIKKYSDLKRKSKSSIKDFKYSSEGKLIKTTDKQYHKGDYNTFVVYYNKNRKKDKGFIIKDNVEELRKEYFYNEKSNLVRIEFLSRDKEYKYEYDNNDNLIKYSEFIKSKNKLIEVIKYKYNSSNKIIRKEVYDYYPVMEISG